MKIYTLTLAVMLFGITLSAQELTESDKNFNRIYDKIAIQVAGQDPNLAIKKADSLYSISNNDFQKFKSLMLKANIYAQIGELKTGIEIAKKAEKISVGTKFYSWQARISGFISTQYRIIGMYNEAKKYLEKTLLYSKGINSDLESKRIQSFVYQEKAQIAIEEKKYSKAIPPLYFYS